MRRASRVDANQRAIVLALRRVGASVESLAAVGGGVPDLLVAFRGVVYLMEIKTAKGKVRASQLAWQADWQAPVYVVRSADEALRVIGALP